ncbi:BamA/TamA family outer membrane protein [Geomonas subterranea]|uniref:BamA/TamA family outer membrane protein n=1 Tax=Geomonas subterranea TaxID=2847989 RepID=A0ABX8LLL5_9BACT|nr:BamA/TamA family outer membrane protein [Geomonas subterranea]QXE92231.1 BamA/TamA family outer membrane protein [Geomonas subterranea]QXM09669.1 BamA/TamA family outer membrane protein [Geomonas subterranea]
MKSLCLAVAALLCLVSVSHAARIDTAFRYSTVETRHFAIHYHQGLEGVARRAAGMAEEIHDKLTREFQWHPAGKTQVVLIDDSDFTNGLAITIPYNTIYLEVVPPTLTSTLGEYDDWLKTLFTHEYAHIVSADPARGYSKVTRAIFGKPLPWMDPLSALLFLSTAPPNTFLPRWWHEGMATWAETKYTGQGRGKSSYYDMIFRTAVAEDNLPTVDQINGDVPEWPSGHFPYIYGYRLQRYIAETYGDDVAGKLTLGHAGRFPYTITGPARANFGGKSYREVYRDMIASLKDEQSRRVAALALQPFTPLSTIYDAGENLTSPRFSPDGSRIAFSRRDPRDHTTVIVTDVSGNKVAEFRRQLSDGSLSWSPDGRSIYFTQAEVNSGFNLYQDLYVYDLDQGRSTRLTEGERLGDVQVSPDGKHFAAVASSRGSQNIVLMAAGTPGGYSPAAAITSYTEERVSGPRFSPDGRSICYVLTDNAGTSSLRIYDLATKTDTPLLSAGSTLAYPAWAPDASIIYYVSDETGVFNVFAYDLRDRKSYQVSHLLSGALQPDPAPDGSRLLVAKYTSRGFKIAQLGVDRAQWRERRGPALPLTRTLPAAVGQPAGASSAQPVPSPAPAAGALSLDRPSQTSQGGQVSTPAPYNALDTLAPRFWLPRIYADGPDGIVLGAFTAGADAVGYHSYALSAAYSSERKRGYYSLLYNNDSFYPTLTLRAHAEPFLYADLYQNGNDYWELNRGVSLQASIPINRLESHYRLLAGYEIVDQEALTPLRPDGTLYGVPVFQGRRDNLFAGIDFDNVLKYPYSVSSEEGRRISLLYRHYARDLGSDINLSEYSATYQEYLRLPLKTPRHQVVYLRFSGALADGDLQFGQQAFQMGGPPSDLNKFPLRGYPVRSMAGKYVATGTLEYRSPIMYPLHGIGTVPAFAEKLHGALFVDAGQVWDDHRSFHGDETRVGAGVELRADVTLGYWVKVTPALGFAHGFNKGGEDQIYFTLYLGL